MNKIQFLSDARVKAFIEFLITELPGIRINLQIKRSSKVPGGINHCVYGFEALLSEYKWNSNYINGLGHKISASDWSSTRVLLSGLRKQLNHACNISSNKLALETCLQILKWGGDRNSKVGATIDLNQLSKKNALVDYLQSSKHAFAEDDLSSPNLKEVIFTGSMWTKIYALNSENSLPIYDSRVAMAIVGLKRRFDKSLGEDDNKYEDPLDFAVPSGTNWKRNANYFPILKSNKRLIKDDLRWNHDTLKLSWILDEVIDQSTLLEQQGNRNKRKHAFEACLFLLGYDLRAIS
jgi:hypothetical protein